jgi:molecular chaperone DnaK
VEKSIQTARETLEKAGLDPHDVERVVFIGGPTHYKPLRDKVAFQLGIAASTDINPMTAVAEGAAVFAESIDWASQSRGRKSTRGAVSAGGSLDLSFNYIARTPDSKAKIVIKLGQQVVQGAEFQIQSSDTGWSSGRMVLVDGAAAELPLAKPGENTFKIFVFGANGGPVSLDQDIIVISRTAASIDAIPASHSIAVEAMTKIGGPVAPEYIVRDGDRLPKKGRKIFKAAESLKAGSPGSLKFRLWAGEIANPIRQNRCVGMFEIMGSDFDGGVIAAGADLICAYEMHDSGRIVLDISVPSIGASFHSGRNFYSRQGTMTDYTKASESTREQSEGALQRLHQMANRIDDPRLDEVRKKLEREASLSPNDNDPETAQRAMQAVQEVNLELANIRKEHLKEMRQLDLDKITAFFDQTVRQHARSSEESTFDNLVKTAQRAINNPSSEFESHISELRYKNFLILWREDWFVIDRFKWLADASYLFPDAREHAELVGRGTEALRTDNIEKLREVVAHLDSAKIGSVCEDDMIADVNIVVG